VFRDFNIHGGLDVAYTNDGINRLTKAEEGTWGGSSISSRTREQNWTLDQVGNWDHATLDRNGNGTFGEIADEYDDDRTHNVANELTARDTNDDATNDHDLVYDGVGNLVDDDENYEYVYDVWGRLRKVKNTSNQNLIAEYWYNGLNFRITFHADTEPDGDVDASDPKYHLIYDERWRLVATYRADDDNPKEVFVSHQAGLDGSGSSSYIDSVILRQRDANSGWGNAADGTMEERRNFCQNWRSDVSALLTSAGVMVEWGKFTAYGLPIGLPAGDIDSDFITDTGDVDAIKTWVAAYDVRADLDLDGDIDATDGTLAEGYEGWQLGWNELSHSSVANRIGYAGYHKDVNLDISHVRNRVLEPHLGRWTRRDPLGYVDGMGLYEYVASRPLMLRDSRGMRLEECNNYAAQGLPTDEPPDITAGPTVKPPKIPGKEGGYHVCPPGTVAPGWCVFEVHSAQHGSKGCCPFKEGEEICLPCTRALVPRGRTCADIVNRGWLYSAKDSNKIICKFQWWPPAPPAPCKACPGTATRLCPNW